MNDDIERELLHVRSPETVTAMRAALDACRLLELDDSAPPPVRSVAAELADEINVVFKALR